MENWRAPLLQWIKKLLVLALGLALSVPSLTTAATINFRDVEIRQFIESMSELTGRNFLMDSRVRGKTTIIASSEVPDDSLYDIMLTVLAMHGFRAVDGAHGLTKIVPANLAPRYSPLDEESSLQTEIIPIRHLDVGNIIPIVRPLMSGEAQVVPFKRLNSLIVTEIKTNIERVKGIIRAVDKKALDDYEIIELKHLKADDIARIIEKARNPDTKQLAKIITDPKNDRIILTGPPENRLPLRVLIAELDTRPTASDQRGVVRVIPLNYANADDMKSVLKGLLTKQFLELASEGDIIDEGTKKTTTKDDDKKDDDKKDDDTKEDKKKDSDKETLRGSGYTVQSDPGTNVLIVSGAANLVQAIADVVERLDVPRPQVLIEAIIASLTLDLSARLSTRLTGGEIGERPPYGGNAITDLKGLFAGFDLLDFSIDATNVDIGVSGSSDGYNLGLLIKALNANQNVNILATPSVMTLNNEKATIKVGESRSVLVGDSDVGDAFRRRYERLPANTELSVTPQITKGDAVNLDIVQKVKDFTESGTVRPPTSEREIETHVVVDDGKIVVLGGLVEETRTETKSSVPLLSRIPILGNLFQGRSSRNTKTNLMVFIRPTIFRTTEEATKNATERYVQLRLEQLQHLRQTDTLLDKKDQSILLPRLESERKPPTIRKRPSSSPSPSRTRSRPSPRPSRTPDSRT